MLSIEPHDFQLIGSVLSPEYQEARYLLEKWKSQSPKSLKVDIQGLVPQDFEEARLKAKLSSPKSLNFFKKEYILKQKSQLLSLKDLKALAQEHVYESQEEAVPEYSELANSNFQAILKENNLTHLKHSVVQFDISIGGTPAGRIVIELYNDVVPKTCQKFLEFVRGGSFSKDNSTKLSYKNTKISRVLAGGWLQAGGTFIFFFILLYKVEKEHPLTPTEIKDKNDNTIKQDVFQDENFVLKHDKPGIVSMVNSGPHSNYSSFMITSNAIPYFDCKYVAFGRVVQGQTTLDKIHSVKTKLDKPLEEIVITNVLELL